MRSRLALVLLTAVLPTASSWSIFAGGSTAPFPDYRNVSNAMASSIRWTYRRPLIRWALAPDFCATMQPLISENSAVSFFISQKWQNFSTCARIHSIIRESFDVWAAANPAITFVDVTSRCEAERMWVPIADDRCAESTWCLERENATADGETYVDWKLESTPLEKDPNSPSWMCSHRTCFECARADVIVGGFTQKNRRLGDQHAKARVQRTVVTEQPPLSPTMQPANGRTVLRAWLEFNVDDEFKNTVADGNGLGNATVPNCWRMDNDVCDWVITIPGYGTGLELSQTILIAFWLIAASLCCACLCVMWGWMMRLAANLLTGWDVDQDGKLDLQEIVYVLDEFCGEICFECQCPHVHQKKMTMLAGLISVLETIVQANGLALIFFVAIMTAGSLVYADGIMTCFVCRDFRASAIHEIGHLLSLDHSTGADGAIPLLRAPAPPPPSPPYNASTGEVYPYDATYQALLAARTVPAPTWAAHYTNRGRPLCADDDFGVILDPQLQQIIPPPPSPPPTAPPPGLALPPPPHSVGLPMIITTGRPPARAPPIATFQNFMGKDGVDHSDSIMIEFGSIGLERPSAGAARRCLSQDDLDGITFLYPTCGFEQAVPPCEFVPDWTLVSLRLLESFAKLMILPLLLVYVVQGLAWLTLAAEDQWARYLVRLEARRLLDGYEEGDHEPHWLKALKRFGRWLKFHLTPGERAARAKAKSKELGIKAVQSVVNPTLRFVKFVSRIRFRVSVVPDGGPDPAAVAAAAAAANNRPVRVVGA